MADIVTKFNPVESGGAYYPQDFAIKKLNLLTINGKRFELTKLLVELSYHEDIYSFCTSGYLTIKDSQGFIESLQLSGNEFIEIDFGKIKDAPNETDQYFRVYKIGDRVPGSNLNTQFYTLYFCSQELIESEQNKISKSYEGRKISSIIENILTEYLKVSSKKINRIEETVGLYDFVVPRLKPFEAISWLSIYARPKISGVIGADMLFYQTKEGYNYRSLQSLFKQEPYNTYKYQQGGVPNLSLQEKTISVLDYEFVKTYDILNEISSGTFANRLISLDPVTRQYKVTDFDYKKYFSQLSSLNGKEVTSELKNRLGKKTSESYESSVKVVTTNSPQNSSSYIKQIPGSVAKDIGIENFVPLRTAQLAMANYTVLKIAIPGDPGITVGKTIQFNLLTIKPEKNKRDLDRFYSGKYLVTAVKHIIQPDGVYQTILEISKDSNPSGYSNVNDGGKEYKKVINK